MSRKMISILYVMAQNHTFGVDAQYIKKIIELPELEIIPGSPNDVAGSFIYGGKIIPTVDMAILMGLPRSESYGLTTIILICTHKEKQIGLIVDKVKDLDLVDEGKLNSNDVIESSHTNLRSIITLNNITIMIPAMEKIIARAIELGEIT